jgi:hypothetical protein
MELKTAVLAKNHDMAGVLGQNQPGDLAVKPGMRACIWLRDSNMLCP